MHSGTQTGLLGVRPDFNISPLLKEIFLGVGVRKVVDVHNSLGTEGFMNSKVAKQGETRSGARSFLWPVSVLTTKAGRPTANPIQDRPPRLWNISAACGATIRY